MCPLDKSIIEDINGSRRLVVGLEVVVYIHVVENVVESRTTTPITSSKGAWHYMYLGK